MNKRKITVFFFCLLYTVTFGHGVAAEKSTKVGEGRHKCQAEDCDDLAHSNETGPADSHETMNARPKRDVDKNAFRNMLLGLVHKRAEGRGDPAPQKFQSDASELLLELMVRIAAHPQQWNEVHELLKKIDSDILTSKKILSSLQNPEETTTSSTQFTEESQAVNSTRENNTVEDMQRLIILLDNTKMKNNTRYEWPNLNDTDESKEDPINDKLTTQNIYPWSSKPIAKTNLAKDFEFAYHRVTGKPLSHSNYDKTRARNAYIAVSVIAPKSQNVRLEKSDNFLEDQLRQLKPWSHQENLNKMENIRKKWFLNTSKRNEHD